MPLNKPLAGLPVAVKDNICIRGHVTSAASKMLEDFVSPYSATVVEALEEAGAVMLGQTNMDEFGMGARSSHSHFGPVYHPVIPDYSPGGSSGGSAVAVASGMALAALGSDTGGSVRLPAAWCGIVGLKPTYGLLSRHGLISYASSLDCIGILARTVDDAALILQAAARPDIRDSTCLCKSIHCINMINFQ